MITPYVNNVLCYLDVYAVLHRSGGTWEQLEMNKMKEQRRTSSRIVFDEIQTKLSKISFKNSFNFSTWNETPSILF